MYVNNLTFNLKKYNTPMMNLKTVPFSREVLNLNLFPATCMITKSKSFYFIRHQITGDSRNPGTVTIAGLFAFSAFTKVSIQLYVKIV